MANAFCKKNSPVGEDFEAFKYRVYPGLTRKACVTAGLPVPSAVVRINVEQGLLMSALLSGVDEKKKLEFLVDKMQFRMSPDDTAVLACKAAVAWAQLANDTVVSLKASAAVTASAAGAYIYSNRETPVNAAATAAAAAAAATLEDALAKAFAANQDVERALVASPFRFGESALRGVLETAGLHNTKPLDLMVEYGLRLTPLTGMHALRSIIAPMDKFAPGVCSSLLLESILQCDGGVDLCYVNIDDDLTAVSFAVRAQRPDMVKILLVHNPLAVNVAGAHLGLTPAHCVIPVKHCIEYRQDRDGHDCEAPNCCSLMNNELYPHGADPLARDRQGIPPILCQPGRHLLALEMLRRNKEFFHPLKQAFRVARVSDPEELRRNKEFTHPPKKAFCAARVTAADEDKRCLIKLIPEDLLKEFVYPHLVSRDPAFPSFPCKPPDFFCNVRTGAKRTLE